MAGWAKGAQLHEDGGAGRVVREQHDCAAGWAKGAAARLRCWLEERDAATRYNAVGWDERGRSYTMTVLLAGREERSYPMMALLAGTDGDSCTNALLAGRKGLSYAADRAAARLLPVGRE